MSQDKQSVYVLGTVASHVVAIPASHVREMVTLDTAISSPTTDSSVRGLFNLRGKILTLYDLRLLLGEVGANAELESVCQLLEARKGDHERWLTALQASVRDGTPFTMARDPTQCAFGRWYSSFTSDNAVLRMHLAKLDAPHRAIHALADYTLGMAAGGERDAALALLERARSTTLAELMRLLDETGDVMRSEHREIVLVLDGKAAGTGLIVDAVTSVQRLAQSAELVYDRGQLGRIDQALLGFTRVENGLALLVDPERLLARPEPRTEARGEGIPTTSARASNLGRFGPSAAEGTPPVPVSFPTAPPDRAVGASPEVRLSGVVPSRTVEPEDIIGLTRREAQ